MKKIVCLILIQLLICFDLSNKAIAQQTYECPYDYSLNTCELIKESTCHFDNPLEVQFIANLFTWGRNWTMIDRVQKGRTYKALGVHTFHVKYPNMGTDSTINKIIIYDDKNEVSEFSTTYLKTFSVLKTKIAGCEF